MSFITVFKKAVHPFVVGLMTGVLVALYLWVDKPLATWFVESHFRDYAALVWVTKLGLGGIYFVGLFAAMLFFKWVNPNVLWAKRCFFLWGCAVFASSICLVLKMLLGRARPDLWFSEGLYGFYGFHTKAPFWSFPSGHTTTIMAVCFGLWALFPKARWLWMLFGATVALSRVLLTHHYLGDVVAASYFALIEVGLAVFYFQKKQWLRF